LSHELVDRRSAAVKPPENLCRYGKSGVNDDSKPFLLAVSIVAAEM
jgi:hypothetical protein